MSETQTQDFNFESLMELAGLDTSDLQAQVSRLPMAGIYVTELAKLALIQQPPQDPAEPMSYALSCQGVILAFSPLVKDNEAAPAIPDGLIGGNLNERIFIYGKNLKEGIQLLMGRFKQAGLRHKGTMGGVEGANPGWIDEALGKRIAIRVSHGQRNGQDVAYFNWMSPKQMKKAGLGWEAMGRDYLDEVGKPLDIEAVLADKKAA